MFSSDQGSDLCAAPEAVLVLGTASVGHAPKAEGEDAGTAGVRPAHCGAAASVLLASHPCPLEYYDGGQRVEDHINTISLFQMLHCKLSGSKSSLHCNTSDTQEGSIHVSWYQLVYTNIHKSS